MENNEEDVREEGEENTEIYFPTALKFDDGKDTLYTFHKIYNLGPHAVWTLFGFCLSIDRLWINIVGINWWFSDMDLNMNRFANIETILMECEVEKEGFLFFMKSRYLQLTDFRVIIREKKSKLSELVGRLTV